VSACSEWIKIFLILYNDALLKYTTTPLYTILQRAGISLIIPTGWPAAVLSMPNEQMWFLQTTPLRLTDVPRRRLRVCLDAFTTLLYEVAHRRTPISLRWPVVVFRLDTADHRSSNQLLRRFTKSKSTRQTDNPAVLVGMALASSQLSNSNSLHSCGLKICHQTTDSTVATSSHFKLPSLIFWPFCF